MSALPGPLPEATRRLYLAEMGLEAYRLKTRSAGPSQRSLAADAATPQPAGSPTVTTSVGAGPETVPVAAAAVETLRCYGPARSPVLVLLKLARLPLTHPAGNEFRRSLGALLTALDRRPDQAFVIAMTAAAPRELLLASLPPAPRVALGFGVDEALADLLPCPLLLLAGQPPPPRAQPDWKQHCWPLVRRARRLLDLRIDP